jgi:hypothetical protein
MSEISIKIFDYKLKGYSQNLALDNAGLFEYKTISIQDIDPNDSKCNIVNTNNNDNNDNDNDMEESSDIRTCDYISSNLKKAQYDEKIENTIISENSNLYFELHHKDFTLTTNDLIKFISINGAKKSKLQTFNFDDITNNMKKMYTSDVLTILNKVLKITQNDCPELTELETTYVAWIKPEKYDQIILIGDVHGSLSTIIRHILRFRKLNIIDKNGIIKKDYKIIFLGDIVDRGIYAYEILILLYMLKIINPTSIYLNRGNHEELDVNSAYGFEKEVKHKIKEKNEAEKIYLLFNKIMDFQSSAIIIENPYNNNENVYLCHGGLPHDIENSNNLSQKFIAGLKTQKSFSVSDNNGKSIRWNDVYGYDKTINNVQRLGGANRNDEPCKIIKIIGNNLINEAHKNGISMIIRGHQDSFHNTKLMKKDTNEWFSIKNYIKEKYPTKKFKCKGSIFNVGINENNKLIINNDNDYMKDLLIPVVTISTNTDYSRNLSSDSCAILEFTDKKILPNCQAAGYIQKKKFFKYTNKIYELFANVEL